MNRDGEAMTALWFGSLKRLCTEKKTRDNRMQVEKGLGNNIHAEGVGCTGKSPERADGKPES